MKFLQTKPHVRNMNFNFFDLFYTVIKNRDDIEIVNNKNENNENDFVNYDFIISNHNISIKPREIILK